MGWEINSICNSSTTEQLRLSLLACKDSTQNMDVLMQVYFDFGLENAILSLFQGKHFRDNRDSQRHGELRDMHSVATKRGKGSYMLQEQSSYTRTTVLMISQWTLASAISFLNVVLA